MAQILDAFPGKLWFLTTKMPAAGSLSELSLSQFQISHNNSWSQIEVTENDALEILISKS